MILAKSSPPETLETHTINVLKVFKSIKNIFPDVPDMCRMDKFWDLLFLSLFLHDFGKGTSGFQNSLKYGKAWGYRHEILSAGFISFFDLSEEERDAVGLAIITHHKDVLELREKYSTKNPVALQKFKEGINQMETFLPELKELYSKIPLLSSKYLGHMIRSQNELSLDKLQDVYRNVVFKYYQGSVELDKRTKMHGKLGIFLKGFLTACDHLASAHHFEVLCFPRLRERIYEMFPELNFIQKVASNTFSDAILIAPTGYGKTEASLLWADNNQSEARGRRLFYFLPYTASINALYKRFKDRTFGDPKYVGVEHGKASYYLYKEFGESEDYLTNAKVSREIQSLTKKIYRPTKIITVFQILKAFFGTKGFEQQLSELVNGLIIVDEVHAYNVRTSALMIGMFRILKKEFGCSFLVMSATMPSFLKNIYKQQLDIDTEITLPAENLNLLIRHHVSILEGSILDVEDKIIVSLEQGKRVLIICNTVDRSRDVFNILKSHAINPMLLHSRFTLEDRENKERLLMQSEMDMAGTNIQSKIDLLVSTQVVEVSLDIDFDVLYSEPAPIDALIQRFGRVNRKPNDNRDLENVYIVKVGSKYDKWIYHEQERISKTLELLGKRRIISELDIGKIIDEVYKTGYTEEEKNNFDSVLQYFDVVWQNTVPFIETENRGEFYEMFDSVEVIPFQFLEKHRNLINNKRYLEAMKYSIGISKKNYNILLREGRIERNSGYSYVSNNYNSQMGLDLKETTETLGIFEG